MRQRLFVLMLATFGIPFVLLLAETVSWAFRAPTVTGTLIKYMPELLNVIFILWFIGIAYATVRVIWPITANIEPWYIRSGARATGVLTLIVALFFAGSLVIAVWLPQVTVRVESSPYQISK